jgi:hypothetical protein
MSLSALNPSVTAAQDRKPRVVHRDVDLLPRLLEILDNPGAIGPVYVQLALFPTLPALPDTQINCCY